MRRDDNRDEERKRGETDVVEGEDEDEDEGEGEARRDQEAGLRSYSQAANNLRRGEMSALSCF